MDSFRLCLALGPVAIYVLLLGVVNLSRRPFVVSGTRDAGALGMSLAGLIIVGPIELFFPATAAAEFGIFVWVLLAALYSLCLVLVLLLLRPRVIIYNMSADQLRPILAELVGQLDHHARWAGDSLALPEFGVQLHVEYFAAMRNVSLISVGPRQNHLGWRRLETALADALGRVEVARNPRGASLIGAGILVVILLAVAVVANPQAIPETLFDLLRR